MHRTKNDSRLLSVVKRHSLQLFIRRSPCSLLSVVCRWEMSHSQLRRHRDVTACKVSERLSLTGARGRHSRPSSSASQPQHLYSYSRSLYSVSDPASLARLALPGATTPSDAKKVVCQLVAAAAGGHAARRPGRKHSMQILTTELSVGDRTAVIDDKVMMTMGGEIRSFVMAFSRADRQTVQPPCVAAAAAGCCSTWLYYSNILCRCKWRIVVLLTYSKRVGDWTSE